MEICKTTVNLTLEEKLTLKAICGKTATHGVRYLVWRYLEENPEVRKKVEKAAESLKVLEGH